jgi:hypothetical protein
VVRKLKLPTVSKRRTGNDYLIACDSIRDYVEYGKQVVDSKRRKDTKWAGQGQSWETVLDKSIHGDLSLVPASDKLVEELENSVGFISPQWRAIPAVVGGAVNAGAFASGAPLCMRQRKRVNSSFAPLSVVADLAVSAGIDKQNLLNRGAAMLSLVRLLAGVRPVKLFLAVGCGNMNSSEVASTSVLVPVNTSPIDLATLANAFSSAGFVRMLGYGIAKSHAEYDGMWPFDDIDEYRKVGQAYWQRFCGVQGGELLFVPPAFLRDKLLGNPAEWLKDMLTRYGGMQQEG